MKARRPFPGGERFLLFWMLIVVVLILAAYGSIMPGPRISVRGDVLPAILLVVCGIIPIVHYSRMSLGTRICALVHSGLAFGLLWVMTFVTVLEWFHPTRNVSYDGWIGW